ncbi:hypothetical protein [Bacillus xiapuensis]|uniref:Uncharacterized protein n=1 Tax=Bacillus xiapuensis TaxID=2014075 RepID=A0ABU6NCQ8_9BACI|nr:hypothetical protein [Bacillus xiapuensis]
MNLSARHAVSEHPEVKISHYPSSSATKFTKTAFYKIRLKNRKYS